MRKSGVLMHITSLPGSFGVGTMGESAFRFVDFLKQAGQHCWQILPLNPTGYGDSPYQSCSTYAGKPYLIDLQLLIDEGLLTEKEVSACNWGDREDKVDFGALYQSRTKILQLAHNRFAEKMRWMHFAESTAAGCRILPFIWRLRISFRVRLGTNGKRS